MVLPLRLPAVGVVELVCKPFDILVVCPASSAKVPVHPLHLRTLSLPISDVSTRFPCTSAESATVPLQQLTAKLKVLARSHREGRHVHTVLCQPHAQILPAFTHCPRSSAFLPPTGRPRCGAASAAAWAAPTASAGAESIALCRCNTTEVPSATNRTPPTSSLNAPNSPCTASPTAVTTAALAAALAPASHPTCC